MLHEMECSPCLLRCTVELDTSSVVMFALVDADSAVVAVVLLVFPHIRFSSAQHTMAYSSISCLSASSALFLFIRRSLTSVGFFTQPRPLPCIRKFRNCHVGSTQRRASKMVRIVNGVIVPDSPNEKRTREPTDSRNETQYYTSSGHS